VKPAWVHDNKRKVFSIGSNVIVACIGIACAASNMFNAAYIVAIILCLVSLPIEYAVDKRSPDTTKDIRFDLGGAMVACVARSRAGLPCPCPPARPPRRSTSTREQDVTPATPPALRVCCTTRYAIIRLAATTGGKLALVDHNVDGFLLPAVCNNAQVNAPDSAVEACHEPSNWAPLYFQNECVPMTSAPTWRRPAWRRPA